MTFRRNLCRVSTYVLPLLIAIPVSTLAADQLAGAKGDVGRMRTSAFGKLPVRFNGRVTTYASVAPIMLAKMSGRDFFIDADGHKQSAVRWLLDVITDSARAEEHQIVPIQNPELLAMLGFVEGVGGAVNADRLPLVNLWRIQTGLPARKQEQMVEAPGELPVAGRTATLIKFENNS